MPEVDALAEEEDGGSGVEERVASFEADPDAVPDEEKSRFRKAEAIVASGLDSALLVVDGGLIALWLLVLGGDVVFVPDVVTDFGCSFVLRGDDEAAGDPERYCGTA